MKRLMKVLFLVFCFMMAGTVLPVLAAGSSDAGEKETEEAEKPEGLVKEDGKYYYYENGEKIKNTLQTITTNGITDYYYFGKDGAAYTKKLLKIKKTNGQKRTYQIYYFKANGKAAKDEWKKVGGYKYYFKSNGRAVCASTTMNSKYNITTAIINGKKYGFDCRGHRASGVYVSEKGKLYDFNKNGVYNETKTKKLRSAKKKAKTDLSSLIERLGKYEGKYKKRKVGNEGGSCLDYGATDVFYEYKHLSISAYRRSGSSTEILYQMYPD